MGKQRKPSKAHHTEQLEWSILPSGQTAGTDYGQRWNNQGMEWPDAQTSDAPNPQVQTGDQNDFQGPGITENPPSNPMTAEELTREASHNVAEASAQPSYSQTQEEAPYGQSTGEPFYDESHNQPDYNPTHGGFPEQTAGPYYSDQASENWNERENYQEFQKNLASYYQSANQSAVTGGPSGNYQSSQAYGRDTQGLSRISEAGPSASFPKVEPPPSSKTIPPNFHVYPSSYFEVGKVVKVNWPSPRGQPRTTYPNEDAKSVATSHDRYKGKNKDIHVGYRRFVVVATYEGSSVALPVSTYEGRGCSKTGAHPKDHGIICDAAARHPPSLLPNEPELGHLTVRVNMIAHETLIAGSRINYVKPSTLEHNIYVQLLGDVHPDDLNTFLGNYYYHHVPHLQSFTATQ